MMLSALQDPEGAQARKEKRLKRRIYHNKVRFHCTSILKIINFKKK